MTSLVARELTYRLGEASDDWPYISHLADDISRLHMPETDGTGWSGDREAAAEPRHGGHTDKFDAPASNWHDSSHVGIEADNEGKKRRWQGEWRWPSCPPTQRGN